MLPGWLSSTGSSRRVRHIAGSSSCIRSSPLRRSSGSPVSTTWTGWPWWPKRVASCWALAATTEAPAPLRPRWRSWSPICTRIVGSVPCYSNSWPPRPGATGSGRSLPRCCRRIGRCWVCLPTRGSRSRRASGTECSLSAFPSSPMTSIGPHAPPVMPRTSGLVVSHRAKRHAARQRAGW